MDTMEKVLTAIIKLKDSNAKMRDVLIISHINNLKAWCWSKGMDFNDYAQKSDCQEMLELLEEYEQAVERLESDET